MNKETRVRIKRAVISSLLHVPELDLPVNIKCITKSYSNCRLIPYSLFMKTNNLSYDEAVDILGSDDGCTDYNAKRNKYIIYYNDIESLLIHSNRYRWNIAHELGHMILGHHKISKKTRLFRNSLSNSEYKKFEDEADYFEAYILVPHAALYLLKISDKHDIKNYCNISIGAAEYRFSDFQKWERWGKFQDAYDLQIRQLFYCIIDRKFKSIYKKCLNCGYGFDRKTYSYCPICGSTNFIGISMEEDFMVYDDGFELDENGKARICPKCGNEQIVEDGDYCKICGTYLANRCADKMGYNYNGEYVEKESCGKIVPGNARFCPYCGNPTTFANAELLKPWEEAKEEIEKRRVSSEDDKAFDKLLQTAQEAANNSNNEFKEIAGDDDLPF